MADLKSLYETDYALWLDRTIADLKERKLDSIDWENLVEEIDGLSKSEKRALRSYLRQLLLHLLKRKYVKIPECYNGWEREIANFRLEIKLYLKESPSLLNYFHEVFSEVFQEALMLLTKDKDYKGFVFPKECPFPIDPHQLLNDTFWE